MFKPTSAKDRINYGEVLMPPVGFHIERAIGTTYSLDLETLTAVSIALGLIEDTDSELMNNPLSMLSALQKISDRIVVFCEAGQIKLPAKSNALCLILEKIVVTVSLPYSRKKKGFPAFHPKTWLLEYRNEDDEKRYRFVVMSRNMTFDHSWDVACTLDGDSSFTGGVDSQPIVDFLKFLRNHLNKDLANYCRQKDDLTYLIKNISTVSFYPEDDFSECEVLPLGIGDRSYDMASSWLLTENFHELVVMSPFLSGSVIKCFNDARKTLPGTTRTLITRRSELSKISNGEASNFSVYVMKDEIVDGERSISDGEKKKYSAICAELDEKSATRYYEEEIPQESSNQDIHAKIYVRSKDNITDLFLGSMNASYAAIYANVEMMLRLRIRKSIINGEKFLNDIMGEDRESNKNPFELVSLDNVNEAADPTVQERIEQLIKKVCRIDMAAMVEQSGDRYNIHITAEPYSPIEGVKIRPLRSNKESTLLPEISFEALEMLQLSEFYVLAVTIEDCTLERVIMIPTVGIPEGREAEVIRNVIKTKKQFIEYVAFILGDDYVQSFLENKKASGVYGAWDQNSSMPAVYEKMLKTAVSDPDRLREIQYITKAIQEEEIIPPEFREMYSVFCNTLGIAQV